MKAFILISLACLSSVVVGCVSKEKSILDERAGYGMKVPDMSMGNSGNFKYVPSRVPEKVVVGWLHKKELQPKVYFWGSWLSIIVTGETMELKKVEIPKSEEKKGKEQQRPGTKYPKKISS